MPLMKSMNSASYTNGVLASYTLIGRFWSEYGRVFDKISLERDVRVVVLTSALPNMFSAGLDSEFITVSPLLLLTICCITIYSHGGRQLGKLSR